MCTNWDDVQHAVHPSQGTSDVPPPSIAACTSVSHVEKRPAGSGPAPSPGRPDGSSSVSTDMAASVAGDAVERSGPVERVAMDLDLHVWRFDWAGPPADMGAAVGALAQRAEGIGVRALSFMDHFFQMEAMAPADDPCSRGTPHSASSPDGPSACACDSSSPGSRTGTRASSPRR
jgi:hypothetical protein